MLRPRIAILDELDSGLDIDALRACARRIEAATAGRRRTSPGSACWRSPTTTGCSSELRPDHVHILVRGQIVAAGGPELADELEASGYAAFTGEPRTAPRAERPVVRPGSLDELFASG